MGDIDDGQWTITGRPLQTVQDMNNKTPHETDTTAQKNANTC